MTKKYTEVLVELTAVRNEAMSITARYKETLAILAQKERALMEELFIIDCGVNYDRIIQAAKILRFVGSHVRGTARKQTVHVAIESLIKLRNHVRSLPDDSPAAPIGHWGTTLNKHTGQIVCGSIEPSGNTADVEFGIFVSATYSWRALTAQEIDDCLYLLGHLEPYFQIKAEQKANISNKII